MKNTILALLVAVGLIGIVNSQANDDITSILNSIENKKDIVKIPTNKIDVHKSTSSNTSVSSSKSKEIRRSQPQITLWQPKDTLPKDIAGQGVYGNFVVRGEDINGGAELIAAEDAANPFARVFTVVNLTSGMAPGTLVPIGQRRLVQVLKSKPLIFIGRGLLPGQYNVQAQ